MEIFDTDRLVKEAHEKGTPIIDVRSKEEYAAGHIPGAVNIPLEEIPNADIQPQSDVYCYGGYRAHDAQEELIKKGIFVHDIGGMEFYHGPIEK